MWNNSMMSEVWGTLIQYFLFSFYCPNTPVTERNAGWSVLWCPVIIHVEGNTWSCFQRKKKSTCSEVKCRSPSCMWEFRTSSCVYHNLSQLFIDLIHQSVSRLNSFYFPGVLKLIDFKRSGKRPVRLRFPVPIWLWYRLQSCSCGNIVLVNHSTLTTHYLMLLYHNECWVVRKFIDWSETLC